MITELRPYPTPPLPPDWPPGQAGLAVAREGAVATVLINRPERHNALNLPTVMALAAAARDLAGDPSLRAAIVTGMGDKAFCAGADLAERFAMSEEQVRHFVAAIREAVSAVAAIPVPTIAAINGVAFGGGLELALACDLRLAAAGAAMGLTEVTLAIIPGAGGTQRLPRLIGPGRAKEMILTGRRVSAEEAEEMGLVNRVVPAGEALMSAARELAATIAANGPLAVRAAKQAIDGGMDRPLAQGLELEGRCYETIIPTADRREGLAAFRERRPPVYRGS